MGFAPNFNFRQSNLGDQRLRPINSLQEPRNASVELLKSIVANENEILYFTHFNRMLCDRIDKGENNIEKWIAD